MDSKTMKARRGMTKTVRRIVNRANRAGNYLLATGVAEGKIPTRRAREALRELAPFWFFGRSPFKYPR